MRGGAAGMTTGSRGVPRYWATFDIADMITGHPPVDDGLRRGAMADRRILRSGIDVPAPPAAAAQDRAPPF